jgi:cysteine-rich repeat protein
MKLGFFSIAATLAGVCLSQPALADVHFIKIVEVYPGSANASDAQYVVLQMFSGGQNRTTNAEVQIFDAAGAAVQTFTFPNDVANAGNQSKILIATQAAVDLFAQDPNFDADLLMDAVIPTAGGKICFFSSRFNFNIIDCASWGNFADAADPDTGTPFNAAGLELGRAMKRNLALSGDPNTLQGSDDSDDSATDFLFGDPKPANNAGVQGASVTCNNGTVEGVETCDGAELNGEDCTTILGAADPAGLACNADCLGFDTAACNNANICGNGLVEVGNNENCDDGNVVAGDGCDAACQLENVDLNRNCGCNVASKSSPLGAAVFFLFFAAPLLVMRRRNHKK